MKTQKIITLFICLTLCFGLCFTSNAATNTSSETATYDLEKGGTQDFTLTDSDGNPVYVTITEPQTRAVANNTYNVSCTLPNSWTAGYKVTVNNNKITKLSSPYVTPFTGSIHNKSLKLESDKQGTLYFNWKMLFLTYAEGVRTKLTSTNLKVSIL